MVAPDTIRRLLEALKEYSGELRVLADADLDDYSGSKAYAGRYLVQSAAQACIDVSNHIIASEGWRSPKDARDAFSVLEEHGLLAPELAERMRNLAGLRNRLVHVYGDIDDRLVYGFLGDGLTDLDAFARVVAALMD